MSFSKYPQLILHNYVIKTTANVFPIPLLAFINKGIPTPLLSFASLLIMKNILLVIKVGLKIW